MSETIAQEIRDRGWCVVEGLLTKDECSDFANTLESLHSAYATRYATAANTESVHGPGDVRLVYNLHNKHKDFLKIIFHDVVTEVAQILLSDGSYNDAEPFQVALTQARGLAGPQPAQQLHIDSYLPGLDRILVLQAAWALSDFEPGNGATHFVEGSHRFSTFAKNGISYDTVEVEAAAGSLILFNGGIWHGSSEKHDGGTRWAIFNRYSRWFMRPSFDHSRNTPNSIFQELTDQQKRMLGFHFRSPVDEFTRVTRISPVTEFDADYKLP